MSTAYTIECMVQFCRQGPGGRGALRTGPVHGLAGRVAWTAVPSPTRTTARSGHQLALLRAQLSERIPRLARLMALALRFEKLIATGVVKDFRTLARLGHVSSARVSQILSLLHLAPDIQEALLFRSRPERGRDSLDLRKVLPLTKVWDWQKQRRLWRGLADSRLAGPKAGAKLAM